VPFLEVRDIRKEYPGVVALNRVELSIALGRVHVLAGENGAGKSTLVKILTGVEAPNKGEVLIDGRNALEQPSLFDYVAYVPQELNLFPHMTVAENIAITPKLLGWDDARMAARVDALLDLVRLDRAKHRDRFPAQLSGGEGQRVGVARALAAEPKIILMDEPFGALDPLTRDALGEDYRRLHDELGLTSVMITHDMLEALLLADRIAVIRNGRIVAEGTPHALMNGEQDDYVRDLMATPRRQAERLRALSDRAPDRAPGRAP